MPLPISYFDSLQLGFENPTYGLDWDHDKTAHEPRRLDECRVKGGPHDFGYHRQSTTGARIDVAIRVYECDEDIYTIAYIHIAHERTLVMHEGPGVMLVDTQNGFPHDLTMCKLALSQVMIFSYSELAAWESKQIKELHAELQMKQAEARMGALGLGQ
jgi:hypothetical protein